MRVRDAVEDDREALGELADAPAEVMANVVHDRTVRVAECEGDAGEQSGESDGTDETGEADETDETDETSEADEIDEADKTEGTDGESEQSDDDSDIVGFVGFDAMPGTVRVTYLRGTRQARERLLEEPVRFARKEGMAVEALVPEDEAETREVVEEAGFDRVGTGPRFDGSRTIEYRLDSA